MSLKKTIEKVISLVVLTGTATNQATVFLPNGKITHVCANFRDYSASIGATAFVRASVQDANGLEVSQMQAVENYATRQGGSFTSSKKPLPVDGGSNYTVVIQATEVFTADFPIEFTFIYEIDAEDDRC